ncbi:hypothetical protein [Muribaculum intestinale]|uniref:hypothetical protein n=1 Tax=Muribaculum intestinale TaxID=1796646 RepID=UPI00272B5AEF|nr:hypothetical protein [Muribaculum intestinale]
MTTKFNFNTAGLFTTDNTRMVAFYRDIMGFETDWNGEGPDVRMQLGNMWIILFPRKVFVMEPHNSLITSENLLAD